MKVPLYSSEMTPGEVSLPKYLDFLVKLYNHPLHPHYRAEKIPKARRTELNSSRGIFGRILYGKKSKMFRIKNVIIEKGGAKIPLRIYQPVEGNSFPVIVFFHGGGYVQGNIDVYDRSCRNLAKNLNAIVASVDYRLAPETPFPGAVEDGLFATRWVYSHIEEFEGDREKIIVMGDSAGGGLAAIVAQESKKDPGINLVGQVLLYPWVDLTLSHNSIDEFDGYIISIKLAELFLEAYLPDGQQKSGAKISPLFGDDLSELPTAFVVTASHDPLRDEGMAYAKKMAESGTRVIFKNYLQTFHGFLTIYPIIPGGKEMYRDFIRTARELFFLT